MQGQLEFDNYFMSIYGDRWPKLKEALKSKPNKVALAHPNHQPILGAEEIAPLIFSSLNEFPNPNTQNYSYYILDLASALVPQWFPITKEVEFLDMCSAPGGKALGYLFRYGQFLKSIELNELSQDRRGRLKKVIENYGLSTLQNLRITPFDGVNYGLLRKKSFDFIVLDAPCGSESHLLQNDNNLNDWKLSRSKRLSSLQYSLLCSALEASKENGEILYMTCSISPLENDFVIEKFLLKKSERVELINIEHLQGEDTKYGKIFLPDQSQMGPLYICHLRVKS